jgi:putative transposase
MPVEIQKTEIVKCPHCNSEAVVKFGRYKDIPRYWCKVCNRKFRWGDKQFKMKQDTEQIATALQSYYDGGSSVRAIRRHILAETGSAPSTATIYEWIQKYSQYLTESVKDYHPAGIGNEWVADETVLKIGGSLLWLWDIIDSHSRMLLSSRLSRSRTTKDAQILIDRAVKFAGKQPKAVLTDQLASYLDVTYGKDAEHIQGSPFSTTAGESTSKIERWHGTLKQRTKVMRGLKNFETALDFTEAYLAYYNFLRPHESLGGKTPAEFAGIKYTYRNWDDVIRNYKPKAKVLIEHQPRTAIKPERTYIGRHPKHVRITPKEARITPPESRITPPDKPLSSRYHYDKRVWG